jgi:serine/threonine-protein kinase
MMSAGGSAISSLGIQVGDVIGEKYRIDAVLGAGGMGVVFAARHTTLNGQFALKFLSREGLANSQSIGRFYREAQAAAKLKSEHAVRVFDVGTHANGLPYIVMEYLEGGDLGRLLRNGGQLPITEAVDYIRQTCAAIADAHKAGIIHRDIKPSNLFCVPREDTRLMIKVLDFGISKVTDALPNDEGVTVTGNFIGSPSYMSPEQMKAPNRVDARTDIWSLGVVLYECVTGKLPFPASTFPEICLRVAQDPPIAPRSYRPDLPVRLEAIILRCLEKDREKRFPSAQALSEALEEFGEPKPVRASESSEHAASRVKALGNFTPVPRSATRTASFSLTQPSWVKTASAVVARRRPLVLALAAAAVTVIIAVVGGVLWYQNGRLRTEVSAAVGSQAPTAPSSPAPLTPPAPNAHQPRPELASPPPSAQPPAASIALPPPTVLTGAVEPPPAPSAKTNPPAPPAMRPAPAPVSKRPASEAPAAAPALPSKPKPMTERDAKSSVWKR